MLNLNFMCLNVSNLFHDKYILIFVTNIGLYGT